MSNIAAGKLRHRIRIEQQVQSKNTFGETETNWEEVGTYWAQIRPLSSRELLVSQQVRPDISTAIVMRYNATINASMRAVHVVNGVDGTIYDLSPPIRDSDSGFESMTIPATSLITQG